VSRRKTVFTWFTRRVRSVRSTLDSRARPATPQPTDWRTGSKLTGAPRHCRFARRSAAPHRTAPPLRSVSLSSPRPADRTAPRRITRPPPARPGPDPGPRLARPQAPAPTAAAAGLGPARPTSARYDRLVSLPSGALCFWTRLTSPRVAGSGGRGDGRSGAREAEQSIAKRTAYSRQRHRSAARRGQQHQMVAGLGGHRAGSTCVMHMCYVHSFVRAQRPGGRAGGQRCTGQSGPGRVGPFGRCIVAAPPPPSAGTRGDYPVCLHSPRNNMHHVTRSMQLVRTLIF